VKNKGINGQDGKFLTPYEISLGNHCKCSCFDPALAPAVQLETAAAYTNIGFVQQYQLCINWLAGIKGIVART